MMKREHLGRSLLALRGGVAASEQTEVSLWREHMTDLALACAGSFEEDERDRLTEARELLAAAPDRSLTAGLSIPTAEQLERMLSAGAASSAALAMLGRGVRYMISRGGTGEYIATIVLSGTAEEATVNGDTLALALMAALALSLADGPIGRAIPALGAGYHLN